MRNDGCETGFVICLRSRSDCNRPGVHAGWHALRAAMGVANNPQRCSVKQRQSVRTVTVPKILQLDLSRLLRCTTNDQRAFLFRHFRVFRGS